MNNADMPAMPQEWEAYVEGTAPSGLTKREYFVASIDARGLLSFDEPETFSSFIGRSIDFEDIKDAVRAQAEAIAKVQVIQADALLAELEKTEKSK